MRRRLKKRIYISQPDENAKEEMFKMYPKELELNDDVNFKELSKLTTGYSGADINAVCREMPV